MKATNQQLKFQSVSHQIREYVVAQMRSAVLSTIYELFSQEITNFAGQDFPEKVKIWPVAPVLIQEVFWRKARGLK